ncbi:hypothetical protein [Effusibacillus dendaii]|uniref:Uncharacterized protein n=1 Tax=Effusibacillus dendaii TaxID=2743772 RepID=A0A7I8D8Z0_9BACL|nr:hypothetical protein [Effusibacillus dendaii]BCJ86467.1 hypothetical protein skT53_14520 [Effusibacillus dendaii]
MKVDYEKLVTDLKNANEKAVIEAEKYDDGGSANLDRVFLRIPGARESKVLEAIKQAGLYCRSKRQWIGTGYFISPTVNGQGNKRYIGVETMSKHLRECGWDTLVFAKMD